MILNKNINKMKNIVICSCLFIFLIFNNKEIFSQNNKHQSRIIKQDTAKSLKYLLAKAPNKNNGTNIENSKSVQVSSKTEDESPKENKIDKLWMNGEDKFIVKIDLIDKESEIRLSVFNILGKEVFEIHNGKPNSFNEYEFLSSNLPNGIYLCILNGRNFRDAEKFIVSR